MARCWKSRQTPTRSVKTSSAVLIGPRGGVVEAHMAMYPVANPDGARPARSRMAEEIAGNQRQLIDLAVAAAEQKLQRLGAADPPPYAAWLPCRWDRAEASMCTRPSPLNRRLPAGARKREQRLPKLSTYSSMASAVRWFRDRTIRRAIRLRRVYARVERRMQTQQADHGRASCGRWNSITKLGTDQHGWAPLRVKSCRRK